MAIEAKPRYVPCPSCGGRMAWWNRTGICAKCVNGPPAEHRCPARGIRLVRRPVHTGVPFPAQLRAVHVEPGRVRFDYC